MKRELRVGETIQEDDVTHRGFRVPESKIGREVRTATYYREVPPVLNLEHSSFEALTGGGVLVDGDALSSEDIPRLAGWLADVGGAI